MTAVTKDARRGATGRTRGAATGRHRLGTAKPHEAPSHASRLWVLDASVAIRWVLAAESEPDAERVMDKVVEEPGRFAVPELFAFEVFSVIARHHPDPLGAFRKAILPVLGSGVLRHPLSEKLAEASVPFVARGLTGCDACYVGLAHLLGGAWLTFDSQAHRRLAGAGGSFLLGQGVPEGF